MPWLVDANGELRPAFANDYELEGGARCDSHSRLTGSEVALDHRAPELGASLPTSQRPDLQARTAGEVSEPRPGERPLQKPERRA